MAILLPPSRGPVVDGPLDPHVCLPGPGHLHEELPNKVVPKGLSKKDHGAGRRWQEGGWLVLLGEVICCD